MCFSQMWYSDVNMYVSSDLSYLNHKIFTGSLFSIQV